MHYLSDILHNLKAENGCFPRYHTASIAKGGVLKFSAVYRLIAQLLFDTKQLIVFANTISP